MGERDPGGAATPAIAALVAAGVAHVVHRYEHATGASFGREAARQLGVDPDRVCKTLVATTGSDLVVAVVPVEAQCDLKALAAAVGAKRAEMAEPKVAEQATGYVTGGISPFGQRRSHTTVLDSSAMAHARVFVSAGRRGLEVEVDPGDLVALLGAAVAGIARWQ